MDLSSLPEAAVLRSQLKMRVGEIWPALMLIGAIAEEKGWALYLVGGAVRDLLLSLSGQPYPLTDIDLVVEGADSGAGVLLAQAIQERYEAVKVQVYGQFQTAELVWPSAQPWLVDIATARTESYPYPAANPEVTSSSIRQDLYRRDFTINAIAMQLTGAHPGTLLDCFGGWSDLNQKSVRVLHANSFIDDPTRIFRAVKFAVRLGFTLHPQTETLIRAALTSGLYEQMRLSQKKAPALQSRLKSALIGLLKESGWSQSLRLLGKLGALACLHPQLHMTPALWQQLHRMDRWLSKFEVTSPHWLLLLWLLIAQLDPPYRSQVVQTLNLDSKSQQCLKNLHQWEQQLLTQLVPSASPSQIYQALQPYDKSELLLIAARHPYTLGGHIWQYVVRLSQMPALINGGTLKQLGYRPGPQFRDMLETVHHLTLDGAIASAADAEDYIVQHYPKA